MGSSGHATVKGKSQERPDINNVLSFEMDTDQSCFLSVISGIESLKDKYGDMQDIKQVELSINFDLYEQFTFFSD